MPAKLDRCVSKVKKQLKAKGLSENEAESRAWAICKSKLKMESQGATEAEMEAYVTKALDAFQMKHRVYWEIFNSLLPIDDRMQEMDQEERDAYVRELTSNTRMILKYGILIPLKESHDQKSERLQGKMISVKCSFKKEPAPHYVVKAEFLVDDEMYEVYQAGKLPSLSPEIADSANLMGFTGKETRVGEYFAAAALLGNSPPAFPNNREISETEYNDHAYAVYSRRTGKRFYKEIKKKSFKELFMDTDKLKEVIAALSGAISALQGMAGGGDEEVPSEEMKEKKPKSEMKGNEPTLKTDIDEEEEYTDEDDGQAEKAVITDADRFADLQKQIDELKKREADSEFKLLIHEGKATPEDRKKFNDLATLKGVAFAKSMFSRKIFDIPPGAVIQDVQQLEKMGDSEKRTHLLEVMKWSEADVDAHFKRLATTKNKS
jgi:hypothetical protein